MKVKFFAGAIFVNNVRVGQFDGTRSMVYVRLAPEPTAVAHEYKTVARFKYRKPMANAKDWLKWALGRFTPAEIIAKCAAAAPLEWSRAEGYENLNTRELRQQVHSIAALDRAILAVQS